MSQEKNTYIKDRSEYIYKAYIHNGDDFAILENKSIIDLNIESINESLKKVKISYNDGFFFYSFKKISLNSFCLLYKMNLTGQILETYKFIISNPTLNNNNLSFESEECSNFPTKAYYDIMYENYLENKKSYIREFKIDDILK